MLKTYIKIFNTQSTENLTHTTRDQLNLHTTKYNYINPPKESHFQKKDKIFQQLNKLVANNQK